MKFWPKIKGQPLWKNLRWRLINFDILIFCQNEFYFTLKHQNIIFRSHLTIYKVLRNLKFWPQIIRLPLWKKSKMAAAEISHLHIWKESLWFHSKTSPNIISRFNLTIYNLWRNLKFWPKIVGSSLWSERWRLAKFIIFKYGQHDLVNSLQRHQTSLPGPFWPYIHLDKLEYFDPKFL